MEKHVYHYEYTNPVTGKVHKSTKTYKPKNPYKAQRAEMIQILKTMPQNGTYLEFYNEFMVLVKKHQPE